jgi:hypothetical protein
MAQSPPWEANSHSAILEIPRLLWKRMCYYHVHKSPPLVPIFEIVTHKKEKRTCPPPTHTNARARLLNSYSWWLFLKCADLWELCFAWTLFHSHIHCGISPADASGVWNLSWSLFWKCAYEFTWDILVFMESTTMTIRAVIAQSV